MNLNDNTITLIFNISRSNPSCTDIMEIYNAVEEMDEDEEVSLDITQIATC